MILRPEKPEDIEVIHDLTQRAFAQMSYSDGSEGAILNRLRADGDLTLSFVAERDGLIVGHIAFSPVLVGKQLGWFGLGPVSVEPSRQRQGIARAMVEKGLSELRLKGAEGCVLIGDPKLYQLAFGVLPFESHELHHFDWHISKGELAIRFESKTLIKLGVTDQHAAFSAL